MAGTRQRAYARKAVGVGTFRSGLEDKVSQQLVSKGIVADYERYFLKYVVPASDHKYTPDFVLPNGLIIETKGIFDSDDRKKHLLIREQHPELDIRFVFSSSRSKLYKGSQTTYADWCIKNGFKFADKLIPVDWLKEPKQSIPAGVLHEKGRK